MKQEPVALIAAIAVIVVSLAAVFHVVLDTGTVETIILDGLIVVQAFIARSQVSPAPPGARGILKR